MDDLSNIIETAFKFTRPEQGAVEGVPLAIVNQGDGRQSVQILEGDIAKFRDRPRRIGEHVKVRTPKALADYMGLYADQNHMAFVKAPSNVRVVLDYHEAGDANAPRWGDHTVTMDPAFSPAYAAWRGHHRNGSSQRDTMEFLEDRLVDVVKPDAADVMDMVMNFEGLTKVTFSSSQRLRDGRVQIVYKEEEADAGKVTFYEELHLMLPVFDGGEPELVRVRVRHRTKDGSLSFVFVIANIEELERAAFDRLCDVWREGIPTGITLREVAV